MEKYSDFSTAIKAITVGLMSFLSSIFGMLGPVLMVLTLCMICDFVTGLMAAKYEKLENPNDTTKGWNSEVGLKGILKKLCFLFAILVGCVIDYLIAYFSASMGVDLGIKTFFGLLVTIWFILNECISLLENIQRMDVNLPSFLQKIVKYLSTSVDKQGDVTPKQNDVQKNLEG